MTKWKINDAALFVPTWSHYFYHVRIVVIDDEGNPLLEFMDKERRGRREWLNQVARPITEDRPRLGDHKLSRVGVYRRRFGFLWWYFVPDGVETFCPVKWLFRTCKEIADA